jgi:hypothetical protein
MNGLRGAAQFIGYGCTGFSIFCVTPGLIALYSVVGPTANIDRSFQAAEALGFAWIALFFFCIAPLLGWVDRQEQKAREKAGSRGAP